MRCKRGTKKVVRILRSSGLSKRQFGLACGMPDGYIGHVLSQRRPWSLRYALTASRVLSDVSGERITVNDLFEADL